MLMMKKIKIPFAFWLLVMLMVAYCPAEVIQTFFETPCTADGSVDAQDDPYLTLDAGLSRAECAIRCAEDAACRVYSHPPCALYSSQSSLTCSPPAPTPPAQHKIFVKTVNTYICFNR